MNTQIRHCFILLLALSFIGGCLESAEHGIQTKKKAEGLSAIATLRAIYSAQLQYQMAKGKYASSIQELKKGGYPLPLSSQGTKGSYTYKVKILGNGYMAMAIPNQKSIKGAKSFAINERGQIFVEPGGKEPSSSSPLWRG